MTDQPIYGVVCAGGGAHGAYQVGVLKYVHEHFCRGEASPFRVFVGTSAGSLNTAFYATRSYDAIRSHLELEELWTGFHVPAYHRGVLRNALGYLAKRWRHFLSRKELAWSLLDPGPLQKIVAKGFQKDCFQRSLDGGTTLGLAVSATELRACRLVWFQQGPAAVPWQTVQSIGEVTEIDIPHVHASCSVPIVFPPVPIGGRYFVDGCVANRLPLTPAMNMGATRILSIAADKPLPEDLPDYPDNFEPGLGDTLRMLSKKVMRDNAANQAGTVGVLNAMWEERSEKPNSDDGADRHLLIGGDILVENYRPVEIKLFTPSLRIGYTDIHNPELLDETIGSQSALLFHRDFVRKLIEFGYDDARNRHDELAEFLDADRP